MSAINPIYSRYGKKHGVFGVKFDPEENRVHTIPKEVTDINLIMRKARETGMIGTLKDNTKIPMYHDLTLVGTYEEIQTQVASIKSSFMELPATVRDELENDPANLVKIVTSNAPEALQYCKENKIGEIFGVNYIEKQTPKQEVKDSSKELKNIEEKQTKTEK